MKVYEIINDWQGLKAGTQLFGPYPIIGSMSLGYYTKENIPTDPKGGEMAFFASAIENNPLLFKNVTQ